MPSAPVGSVGFADGGLYVLRRQRDHCLVDCGDVGLRGRGGHGHNDALSCELTLSGIAVLTDTGCASYTRRLEDRLRTLSAASHNVATVAGAEPAVFDLAAFPHATGCPVEALSWDPRRAELRGRHLGFARRGLAGAYERRIALASPGGLEIDDRLEAAAGAAPSPAVTWHFQLAEGWRPVDRGGVGDLDRRRRADAPARLPARRRAGCGWRGWPGTLATTGRSIRWRLELEVRERLPVEGRFHWRLV